MRYVVHVADLAGVARAAYEIDCRLPKTLKLAPRKLRSRYKRPELVLTCVLRSSLRREIALSLGRVEC